MSGEDITDLRRWHRAAVERAIRVGYDIVYVYAGHGLTTIQHFLSPRHNLRTDEYGGPIENRARLLRELLEDTIDAAAGRAAVAYRIAVHEMVGDLGNTTEDIRAVLGLVGELPDLWDFMVGEWEDDSVTSRFGPEGNQEEYVRGLKALTSRPVVGVGRFTSPETMLRIVNQVCRRFHRSSTAVDRRPVPAEQDRRGPFREDPGVHRMQHLRLRRLHDEPDPVHAEPRDGTKVASRVAPRAVRPDRDASQGPGCGGWSRRARGRDGRG
jgi:hypothetical protein